ncbi:MAG: hypothetical protein C0501_10365 [Isosphaera sp.]|nr:hypothetical protein [Isosphaera sp.]
MLTRHAGIAGLFAAPIVLLALGLPGRTEPQDKPPKDAKADKDGPWTESFPVEPGELGPTGRNPYFILEPGYVLVLRKGNEELTVTVLDETKKVDGVETRVVEERETKNGKLVEVSRNFFAISKRTNSVYYFGEEVDIYDPTGTKVVAHDGAWLSGVKGAKFGLMMPGTPLVGGRYYNEIAPDVALDRSVIVSVTETVETIAGTFKNCVKVEETTPLEPDAKEYKYYAPGVGLVNDDKAELVKYGKVEQPKKKE